MVAQMTSSVYAENTVSTDGAAAVTTDSSTTSDSHTTDTSDNSQTSTSSDDMTTSTSQASDVDKGTEPTNDTTGDPTDEPNNEPNDKLDNKVDDDFETGDTDDTHTVGVRVIGEKTVTTGDLTVNSEGADEYTDAMGVKARGGATVTTGNIKITGGVVPTGVSASESTVTTGSITASGDEPIGVDAYNGSTVTVNGNVSAAASGGNIDISEGGTEYTTTADGVEVDATSKVTVNGNVEALTTEHDTVARGVSAEGGAIVLVTGDVIVPGDFGIGLDIDAYDKEGKPGRIEVTGSIKASDGIILKSGTDNDFGDGSAVPIIVTHAVEGSASGAYSWKDDNYDEEESAKAIKRGTDLLDTHVYYSVAVDPTDSNAINLTTYTPITDSIGRKAYLKDTAVNIKVESSKTLQSTAGTITRNADGTYTLTIPAGGNVNLSLQDLIEAIEDSDHDDDDDASDRSSQQIYTASDGSTIKTVESDIAGTKATQETKQLADGSSLTATIYNPTTSFRQQTIAPLTVKFETQDAANGKSELTMTTTSSDTSKVAVYAGAVVTEKLAKLEAAIQKSVATTAVQKETAAKVLANVNNTTAPAGLKDSGLAYYVNTDVAPNQAGASSAKLTINIPGKDTIAVTIIPADGSNPYVVLLNASNAFTFDCPNAVYYRVAF